MFQPDRISLCTLELIAVAEENLPPDDELVDLHFKILSDHNRRSILTILKSEPGLNVQELCSRFPTSRFAVMKHLNILEDAGLLYREREGKSKKLYVQTDDLLTTVDPWIRSLNSENS
ncbi:MAG: helix-turn-helix domain-containing protein [Candidatus Marinimicrobia bacterium]|nr:helix-turn-helix domain-containing protein [Candidatus Neomarinimicrobiota bacterium]